MPARSLLVAAGQLVVSYPALAGGGLFGTPLGLNAPALGLRTDAALGTPLALPVLAFAGGVALVCGVRFIKRRRQRA